MRKKVVDSLVIGFALFSMFFGAGNVIFPPYLGLGSGDQWPLGFLGYYIADVGPGFSQHNILEKEIRRAYATRCGISCGW